MKPPYYGIYLAAGLDHNLTEILIHNETNVRKAKRLVVNPNLEEKNLEAFVWNSFTQNIGLIELEQPFEFGKQTNIMPGM